jgi:hypothetical protein
VAAKERGKAVRVGSSRNSGNVEVEWYQVKIFISTSEDPLDYSRMPEGSFAADKCNKEKLYPVYGRARERHLRQTNETETTNIFYEFL